MKRYRSFDLMISPVEGTPDLYWARVIDSPSGQGRVQFRLPTAIAPWQDQLELIGGAIRAANPRRSAASPEIQPLDPKVFGEQLFTAIFHGEVAEVFQQSLATVNQQGEGLRIRLRLDEAPDLAALPWEYLYHAGRNRFFVLTDETPIVRYLALPQAAVSLTTTQPLRILVLTAAANDVPQLDIATEEAHLRDALQLLETQGNATVTWLQNGTLHDLRSTLRRGEYHILHFIGHGWFDEAANSYGLILVDEKGASHWVTADVLGMTLQNHRSLRLAFLNACEGARLMAGVSFGGVAHQLVQQGLPAVIAMQFPVTDQAAIALAREFYNALADVYPVDAALAQARLAMYSQESVMEWGTPVLFMRAGDGRLWKAAEETTEKAIEKVTEKATEVEATKNSRPTQTTNINSGGGMVNQGNLHVTGDFIGRNKVVHGDEVKGDKVMGDKVGGDKVTGHKAGGDVIVATVGAGSSNVAIGKNVTQHNLGAPTADDKALIEAQLTQVTTSFQQIRSQLDPTQIPMIQFQLQLLQGELTKTADGESPSATTVTQVSDWLLDNVPALVPALRALFTLPAVTKVLAKAGPTAVTWQQRRFSI